MWGRNLGVRAEKWGSSRCSPVSMFPDLYVPRSYVPQYLCFPVSMSSGPMFPDHYVPRSYVPPSLCSSIPMFPDTYVPPYLSSQSFLGGEQGLRSLGTIVDKIRRLSSFFKTVAAVTLDKLLCSLRDKKKCQIIVFYGVAETTLIRR